MLMRSSVGTTSGGDLALQLTCCLISLPFHKRLSGKAKLTPIKAKKLQKRTLRGCSDSEWFEWLSPWSHLCDNQKRVGF